MTGPRLDSAKWSEYDSAAAWCAKRGIAGDVGDPLPDLLGGDVCDEIDADVDAFADRVRATAYMLACERSQVAR
jgi:hypothetical protein